MPLKTNSAGPKDGEVPAKSDDAPAKVEEPIQKPAKEQPPQMSAEELKALKKERALKRKKAAEALYEPRVLRPRKSKDEQEEAQALSISP